MHELNNPALWRQHRDEIAQEVGQEHLARLPKANRIGKVRFWSKVSGYVHGLIRPAVRADHPGGDCLEG